MRQRPDAGAAARIGGQQRRLGMHLVQVLHDGHRLKEHVAVVLDERGDHHLRVDGSVLGLALLAGIEIDVDGLVGEPLEIKGDADAEGGERAPVGIELHQCLSPEPAVRMGQ